MADYSKNFENAMSGHAGIDIPVKSSRSNLDDMADVRDLLSALVGAGKGGLRADDQSAVYSRLAAILGKPTASKLITQVHIFNERPDTVMKNAEQRITQFYDTGSRDPELDTLIKKTKTLGQGPLAGANQSVNDLTKKVYQGVDVKGSVANTTKQDEQLSGGLKTASGL